MKYSRLNEFDLERTFEKAVIMGENEKKFVDSFKKYSQNFEEIRKMGLGILMSGNAGTGKTFYTTCILNELVRDYKVLRTSLSELLEEIRRSYERQSNDDFFTFRKIENAELIILDDLGNEYLSEWGKEKMFVITNHIYEHKIPLIINTNLDSEQFSRFLEINGSNKLYDRITSVCKLFLFDWESRRRSINKKKIEELF